MNGRLAHILRSSLLVFMTFVVSGFTIVVHHDRTNAPDRRYVAAYAESSSEIAKSTSDGSDMHVVKFLTGESFRSKTAMHYLGYSVFSIATAAVLESVAPEIHAESSLMSSPVDASFSPFSRESLFHRFRI